MRFVLSMAMLFACGGAAPLLGQVPLLTAAPNPAATGVQKFLLRNSYHAAATEWVTATSFPLSAASPCAPNEVDGLGNCGRTVLSHRWGLPAVGDQQPIPAGGARAIGRPPGSVIKDVAVIYADGATAGDPAVVLDLLQARQAMLDDLRQVIPMLTSAAHNPAENYGALEATLTARGKAYRLQRVAAYRTLGGAGAAPTSADRVCQPMALDIADSLKAGLSPQAMSARYTQLAALLVGWERQLEASKPALQ